jgi:Leucine-rich repeat (LRR) protein
LPITKLANLQTLLLYDNKLSSLPAEIGQLKNLIDLFLDCNFITSLPPEIGDLTSLWQLCINSNQLSALPPEIGRLENLAHLLLSGNKLTILPDSLCKLSNLLELQIGGNQLINIPTGIGRLNSLEGLYLSGNRLSKIPAEIGNLKSLFILNLSCNQLTELPAIIGKISSLGGLRLDNNQLTTIPDEFVNLKLDYPMGRLSIDYNHIDPAKLKPEITAWINKYSLAGWEKTQILSGISLQTDYSGNAFRISLNRQSLKLNFDIVGKKNLKIDLFNIKGSLIAKIADEMISEGIYTYPFNYYKLGSGIYIIRGNLEGQNFIKTINYLN